MSIETVSRKFSVAIMVLNLAKRQWQKPNKAHILQRRCLCMYARRESRLNINAVEDLKKRLLWQIFFPPIVI